jgi:phasin family protein
MAEASPAIEIENAVTSAAETAVETTEKASAAASEAVVEAVTTPLAEAAPAPKAKRGRPRKPAVVTPPVAKRAAPAKRTAKAKPAAKPAAKAPAKIKTVKKPVPAKPKRSAQTPKSKETIMAKTTTTDAITGKIKTVLADVQERAKAAYEKSTAAAGEMTEFTKGNVEAVVTSSKILASGLQDLGKTYVDESKTAFETLTTDAKALAAVKTPTDFFKLQSELMRRNFDTFVATGSKHSEEMVKLANEAFAPLSTRMSLAMEKAKLAAYAALDAKQKGPGRVQRSPGLFCLVRLRCFPPDGGADRHPPVLPA